LSNRSKAIIFVPSSA